MSKFEEEKNKIFHNMARYDKMKNRRTKFDKTLENRKIRQNMTECNKDTCVINWEAGHTKKIE